MIRKLFCAAMEGASSAPATSVVVRSAMRRLPMLSTLRRPGQQAEGPWAGPSLPESPSRPLPANVVSIAEGSLTA
jgi:hypothetical protein